MEEPLCKSILDEGRRELIKMKEGMKEQIEKCRDESPPYHLGRLPCCMGCHLMPTFLFPWQEVPLVKLFPQIKKEDAEKTLQSGPLAILVSDLAVPLGVICQCCSKGECCPADAECYDVEQGDVCPPADFRVESGSDCTKVSFALGVPVEGDSTSRPLAAAQSVCDAQCKGKFKRPMEPGGGHHRGPGPHTGPVEAPLPLSL